MLAHGAGIHVPEWISPVATFVIVGYFFYCHGGKSGGAKEVTCRAWKVE
jgi:hypothetical protein